MVFMEWMTRYLLLGFHMHCDSHEICGFQTDFDSPPFFGFHGPYDSHLNVGLQMYVGITNVLIVL